MEILKRQLDSGEWSSGKQSGQNIQVVEYSEYRWHILVNHDRAGDKKGNKCKYRAELRNETGPSPI